MNVIKNSQFIPAKFTSVWDGGIHVTTDCMVDPATKRIVDIELADVTGIETLDYEYVTVNGIKHPAGQLGSEDADYYYE